MTSARARSVLRVRGRGPRGRDEEAGDVLSVLGRWDFRITDPESFLAAGRQAYAKTWPDGTAEDAEIAVQTPHNVVSELLTVVGWAASRGHPGWRPASPGRPPFVHDGTEVDDDDPFRIVHE